MAETMAEKMVKEIRKGHGDKAAYLAKDMPNRGGISSGSLALDYAIGPMGGFPRDRIIELFGPESSGKTTLALMGIANFLDAQPKRGALILDTEHKLTEERLKMILGTKRMERLVVTYPDHIEQAQDIYTELIPSGDISIVLLDSIGGSPNKTVTERSAEDADYGNAKAVTRFGRIASGMTHKYEACTIGVNQLRDNMNPNSHALITPGGKGWKYNCMLRVYLRKGKGKMPVQMGNDTVIVGYTVAGRCEKNHLGGIEGREFSYWFYNAPHGSKTVGVDQGEETARLSVATGVVERSGGWYAHPALPGGKVQGQEKLTAIMDADESIRRIIADATMEALRAAPDADEVFSAADPDAVIPDPPDLANVPLIARDNVLRRGL